MRSIAAPATAFVSPSAIRRAIAGHAAAQGWAPSLTAGAVREGMALALAVAGLAVQMPGVAGAEPWTRAVPTTFEDLQALTGLERSGVRGALEVLASAAVLRSGQDDAGLTLTLASEDAWAPHPLLAAAPWSLISLALTRAAAPVRAALVVFAELALETEAMWRAQSPTGGGEPAGPPPSVWLELTLKELAHRVHYHLSHVENALAGLESAGCLTRLRGTSGRALRIAAWTVGADAPPADVASANVPSAGATAGQVVIEFGGVRAIMAPGDTLDVSGRDADGQRILRIRTDDGDVVIRPPRRTDR